MHTRPCDVLQWASAMLPTLAVGAGISTAPPRGFIEANIGYLGTDQPLPHSVPVDAYSTHRWSETLEQIGRSLEHGTCQVGRLESVLFLVRDGPPPLTSPTSDSEHRPGDPPAAEEPPAEETPEPEPTLNAAENHRLDQKLWLLTQEVAKELEAKGHPRPFQYAQSIISLRSVLLRRPEPEQEQEANCAILYFQAGADILHHGCALLDLSSSPLSLLIHFPAWA